MGSKNGKPVLRDEDIAALSKSSGLDEAQVKESFNVFVAEHPNGKMKPKDFREMMAKAVPKKMLQSWRNMSSGYMMLTMMASLISPSLC
jgi:hypothetical protein